HGDQRGIEPVVADDVGAIAGSGVGAPESGQVLSRNGEGIGAGVVEHDVAVGHGDQDVTAVGRSREHAAGVDAIDESPQAGQGGSALGGKIHGVDHAGAT